MLSATIGAIVAEKDFYLSLAAAAFSALALYLMFADGIRLGQHGILTGGFSWHLDSIVVAISRVAYRTGSNYLGLSVIRQLLVFGGLPPQREMTKSGGTLKLIDRQPDEINKLFRTASRLPWPMVLGSGSYIAEFDLGYSDYATLAFRLFGLRIEAMYYLYFTLLGASCALFVLVNFDNPAALWSIAIMLLSLRWLKLYTTMFDESDMNYVYAYHFLSTLTLVPALHIAVGVLSAQPFGWPELAACVIQCCILSLALRIRYSGAWVLFAIAAATVSWAVFNIDQIARLFSALLGVVPAMSETAEGSGSNALGAVVSEARGLWLLAALALSFVVLTWRYRRRLSPVFKTDEVMDSYTRYHGAYLGLAMDETTWQNNMRRGQTVAPTDLNGVYAVKYWLLSKPGAGALLQDLKPGLDEFHSQIWEFKWRPYEHLIRLVFLDYCRKNLRSLPRLYLLCKPRALLRAIAIDFRAVWNGLRRERPLASALLAATASLPAGIALAGEGSGPVVVALVWFALAAPAPQIWAYTIRHSLADQAWVALFATWMLLLWAIANGVKGLAAD
jgi:hypothetical protein